MSATTRQDSTLLHRIHGSIFDDRVGRESGVLLVSDCVFHDGRVHIPDM